MAFSEILPSKQFTFTILSLLVAAVLISFAADWGQRQAQERGVQATSERGLITSETDTDGDGLRDWEEALWGTDPEIADTDEDGTEDGAEIDAERNPLVAGPSDSFEDAPPNRQEVAGGSSSELTRTDVFSRKLFSSFLTTQKTGELDDDAQQRFVSGFLQSNFGGDEPTGLYTSSDFSTTGSSPAELRSYGNTLGSIVNTYASQAPNTNELIIIRQALQEDNPSRLQELSVVIELYKVAAGDLGRVSPPQELLDEHVAITNNVARVAQSLEETQGVLEDPVAGIEAFTRYQGEIEKIGINLQEIQFVFVKNEVIFSSDDLGSLLFE